MNIVICSQKFLGLAECLTYCGYNIVSWNQQSSIFDLFYEFRPELFIIEYKDINEVIGRCLKQNPQTRLVVHDGIYNRCDLSISDKMDNSYFFLPQAANVIRYPNPKNNKIFECDIAYIGNNHPIFNKLVGLDLNIKAFGECKGSQYYCGYIRQELIGDLFKTAKIVLHLHQEESSQQLFDIAYCNGTILSDSTPTTKTIFNNKIEYITKDNISDKIYQSINFNNIREDIFNKHTYFDRAKSLFKELGLSYKEFQIKKNEFKNKYF